MIDTIENLRALRLLAILPLFCLPAIAEEVSESLLACAAENDEQRRLECYDREAAGKLPAANQPKAAAATQTDDLAMGEPARQTAVPEPEPEPQKVSSAAKEPDVLYAAVTKIARQPRGEHVVYLDNGQVWVEQIKSSYFPVDVGDTISLKKRKVSGYRLLTTSGKGYNVKRLR